jgi:pimeloyl-ACP methyl ester carboxylesterase
VLFDHRGHGRSAAAAGRDYSLRAMGDDVAAVLDASVTNGPAVLVGHSMGGMAVLALAEAHPEEFGTRVAGVVLADTAAAELLRGALGGVASRIQAVAGDAGHAERVSDFFRSGRSDLAYLVARLTNFGRDADPSLVEYVAGISGHAPLEVWSDALAGVLSLDVRHALSNIVVPALVIVGDVDRLTPPTSAKAMAEELPEADLIVLEGAGHLSMLERPGRFNRVLTAFVDRVLGADPVSPGQPRIGTAT